MMDRTFPTWLATALTLAIAGAASAQSLREPPPPNVLVILADDVAFTDFGTYGGEARTPSIDALAARGTTFASHHASPLCSPTRAMLLTGIDNHRTGVATIEEVIPPEQAGKPGYSLRLEQGVQTIATRLKAAGYRTYMTGKWHLGHEPGDLPSDHGFDRSLALDASGADNWAPKPYMPYYTTAPWYEDGKPAQMPAEFYSSELLVDRMIDYLRADEKKAEPFFAYLSFQANHIPVQAPRDVTERYAGKFDGGWEALRRARWERARERGLVAADAPFAPAPATLRSWSSLDADDRRMAAKSMQVYSAMIEVMDQQIGRLLAWLESTGQLANTVVFVTSDNGPEPSDPVHATGMNVWMAFNGYTWDVETLGERGSLGYIGPEWAAAASSPGSLFKFYTTEGGTRVPFVVAGPGVTQGGRVGTPTFVTDIAPTIMEMVGAPAQGGMAMTGRSLGPVLRGESDRAHPTDAPVGMEVSGQAALFKGDFKLVRNGAQYGDGAWHVYDIARDPGETNDLAPSRPDLAAELRRDYDEYTRTMGVLPMPEGYDIHRAVLINSAKRQFSQNPWPLVIAALVLVTALWLVVRLVRRVRRAA